MQEIDGETVRLSGGVYNLPAPAMAGGRTQYSLSDG